MQLHYRMLLSAEQAAKCRISHMLNLILAITGGVVRLNKPNTAGQQNAV